MSLTKPLSTRIIVIIETVAIVVLSVIVVIYAQVLFQQYVFQANETIVVTESEVMPEAGAGSYTPEERMHVLQELETATSESAVVGEERQAALESLVLPEALPEISLQEQQERMKVLESLNN